MVGLIFLSACADGKRIEIRQVFEAVNHLASVAI